MISGITIEQDNVLKARHSTKNHTANVAPNHFSLLYDANIREKCVEKVSNGPRYDKSKKVGLTILKEYMKRMYLSNSKKTAMDYLETKTSEQISDAICKSGALKKILDKLKVKADFCLINIPTNDKYNLLIHSTDRPKPIPTVKNKGVWHQLSKTSFSMNITQAGTVNQVGT